MNTNGIVRREGGHIEFLGYIEAEISERLMRELYEALNANAEWIMISMCSGGGDGHIAFQLYSRIWKMVRINDKRVGKRVPLWTCAAGDVASAGVVLFMAGERRHVTQDVILGFHEPTISFSSTEHGIAVQDVRNSIDAIDKKKHCLCDDQHVRILIKHLAQVKKQSAGRWRPYIQPFNTIARLADQGRHCCDHGPFVVKFLQELVRYADRSSYAYAGIIARRAGMPINQVLDLMRQSARIDGINACMLGLAHECV